MQLTSRHICSRKREKSFLAAASEMDFVDTERTHTCWQIVAHRTNYANFFHDASLLGGSKKLCERCQLELASGNCRWAGKRIRNCATRSSFWAEVELRERPNYTNFAMQHIFMWNRFLWFFHGSWKRDFIIFLSTNVKNSFSFVSFTVRFFWDFNVSSAEIKKFFLYSKKCSTFVTNLRQQRRGEGLCHTGKIKSWFEWEI